MPLDRVTDYATKVDSGEIVAGPQVRNACARHLRDLKDGPARGLRWDVDAADRVFRFFENVLKLSGGQFESKPFVLLDWQSFILGSLFGWKIEANDKRRFRVSFIETGKGSGKSPLAAGVGLYMMIGDNEPRAEIYAAATKRDQAKVLFRDAVAMVELSGPLSENLDMSGGKEKQNIAYLDRGSFFRPIATENMGRGQSGPRPHCGLLDEVHEHPTNAMVEFLLAGIKFREQPLIFMITNSGNDVQTVCYEYHDYAIKVAAGDLEDDSFFGYVCMLDEGEEPFADESCWPKVNPSLGVTIQNKYLRDQVNQARGMPSKENIVRRLNFCQWTDAETAWINRESWSGIQRDLDLADYSGRKCYAALDLSGKKDLTALALLFPDESNGGFDAFVEFWTPDDTLVKRSEEDRVPYMKWKTDGYLMTTPGSTVRYSFVAARIGEISARYDLQALGFDRWRITDLKNELEEQGIPAYEKRDGPQYSGIPMIEVGQGYKDMAPAVDDLEEAILGEDLRVSENPVLTWNASSAVLEEDAAGNRKFTKKKSRARIDGIVALAMAVKLAKADAAPEEPNVFIASL